MNKNDYIILPRTASFEDTSSSISYDTGSEEDAAIITYTYHGVTIGTVHVNFSMEESSYSFDTLPEEQAAPETDAEEKSVVFINTMRVLIVAGIAAGVLLVVLFVRLILRNYQFSSPIRKRSRRRRWHRRRRSDKFRDYDF